MTDTKTSAKAKPDAKTETPEPEAPREPYAVFGNDPTDEIRYSRARVPGLTGSRKSITVLHIQRRLEELGYPEAEVAQGGRYDLLTETAIKRYQTDNSAEATGVLTRDQFAELFRNDPNVSLVFDTVADN